MSVFAHINIACVFLLYYAIHIAYMHMVLTHGHLRIFKDRLGREHLGSPHVVKNIVTCQHIPD